MEKSFHQTKKTYGRPSLYNCTLPCTLFPLDFHRPTKEYPAPLEYGCVASAFRFLVFLYSGELLAILDGWTGWLWAPFLLS